MVSKITNVKIVIDKMDLTYQGCQRHIDAKIRLMLVRGCIVKSAKKQNIL